MELIKALFNVTISISKALFKVAKVSLQEQRELAKQRDIAIEYQLNASMVSFYHFLLTRGELNEDDIRYLLNEHEKHERARLQAEAPY